MCSSRLRLLPVTAPQTGQGKVPLVMTESRMLEGGGGEERGGGEEGGGGEERGDGKEKRRRE